MNKRCNKKIRMLIFFILSFLPAILCGLLYAAILSSSSLVRSNTENQNLSDIVSNKKTKKSSGNYSDKKQLLTDADNQTEPWSDAFNFDKTWNTQTDPRTGILTVFIKVGSMISNLGHGPDIALKINYSSGSTANPDALGAGWSWNLTHFNVRANQLTTSTGQNFHLQREADNKWKPLYHKLKDIDIRNNTRNGLIITYANGLREILNNEGYEIRLEQQDGNAVNFFYAPGTHLLTSINDNQNHYIKIIYHENYIIVISQGTEGQLVKVRINNSNNQLQSIVLPVQNSLNESGIYIIYKGHLITELDYPTGLKKIFSYNCTNAIRMIKTDGRANISLCAVSSETVITGINQPPLVTHYAYSETNTNNHNYLGFNSGLSPAADYSGRDQLFEVPAYYTYQTLEDNQLVKEIRTYNKYHLLINDKKISDRTGHTLSEINNFYCRADQRNSCAHTTFKDLPATYALPLKTVTKVWGDNNGKPDISTVSRIYDKSGRTIRYEDDYGRVVKTIYCPIKGDAACPAVSKEWMLSILPESMTVYPSKKITSRQHVATLPVTTYNYYRRESNRNGGGYILVLDHQIHQSGNAQIVAHRYYYNDSYNALTYGLLQKTTVKKIHNNSSQLPERIRHYYYTKDRDNYSKTFYSTIELEKGKLQRFPEVTTSLFTNQILQKSNITGTNITRYHYDTYGRLIQQDIAVHTPFAAYVHYKYTVSPVMNQVLITAANGLQYKVIFDSTGRKLQQWNETVSVSGRAEPGQWLLKKQFDYDRYGHLAKVYGYMVNALKKTDKLMTTYNYDEMGLVTQIKLPDGQRVFKLYNDSKRCMIHYRMNRYNQRSAVSVVHYNVLNKPIEQITLPAFQGALSAVKRLCQQKKWQQEAKVIRIAYDGFGRVVSTTNPAGRTITKTYNSLGEVALIKDSSGHEMYYSYDLTGHLIHAYKKYKTSAGFDGWLMYSAQYNPAGQLMWRRNASQQQTTYTYNTDGNLITIVTPAGHIISFQYNLLGLPVAKYIDEKLYLKSDYNPVTLLLIKKTDSTGITRYIYGDDGALQQEIHTGQNGDRNYKLQWFYNLNRRVIAVTDIDGNKTLTQYDSLGRITALYYQTLQNRRQLLTESVYDDFSRTRSIRYGSGMQRSIDYDGYGRRNQVKDILNNQLLSKWNYTYDAVDNIISLKQQGKNNKTGWLNYRYDTQNNLIAMTCHGSAGLPLCPRDSAFTDSGLNNVPVIIRQNYHFNPLNRMTELKEVLQNSSAATTLSKVISYHYYDNIPLRFQSVSTRWNNNAPVVRGFNYDTAGNMITDTQGNRITYNPLNQITSVITIQGEHSCYGYNGSDKEVMEKTPFSIHHLFYRGRHLINESIYSYQDKTTHIVGYKNIARTMDGVIDQYYEKNYKGDITGVLTQSKLNGQYVLSQSNTYSPYGMSWHHSESSVPFYQQLLTGFNSERTDPVTHWQFLGAGHRTYNPQQHYFISEDPAGDGYAFAANNPIMKNDPDGNIPQSMGRELRIANAIATFGFGFIHKYWANIVGSVVTGVISAASVGFGALAVLRDPQKAGFAAAIFAGLFSVSLISVLQTKSKAMAIIGAITGSIAVLTTFAVDSAALGVGLVKGVQRIAGMWRLADVAGELSSEDMAEQLGAIPLRVLKSTESPVSLREELPENLAEKLLNENPHLMISEGGSTDYLILHSDEDVDEAVSALKNVRSMDDNVAALFTASKLSQKLVNLNSVDEYLTTMEQSDRRYSLLGPFVSETEREAAGKLFEPFGPMKFNRISQIPEDLSSDIDNLRFIGRNMRGAFVAYTDQNNDCLIVAKYSHMQGIIVRISVRSDDSVYRSVEAYTVF